MANVPVSNPHPIGRLIGWWYRGYPRRAAARRRRQARIDAALAWLICR